MRLTPKDGARDDCPAREMPVTDNMLFLKPKMESPCTVTAISLAIILHVSVPAMRPLLSEIISELPLYNDRVPVLPDTMVTRYDEPKDVNVTMLLEKKTIDPVNAKG